MTIAATRSRPTIRLIVYWSAVASLLAFNVWWLARDLRPLPTLKTIAAWTRQQRVDEAETALREHLRRTPHNVEALILLAGVRAARDDKLGAARLLHAVPDWWSTKHEMRALEGQLFLDSGRARDAEAAWRRCLDDAPAEAAGKPSKAAGESALALLSLLLLERRDDDAHRLVEPLYGRADPVFRLALLRARLAAEWTPRPSSSDAPTLRRWVAADPDDWQARRALALAEQALGQRTEALRLIEQCRGARADDLLVRRDWLTILREQGDIARFVAEARDLPPGADQNADLNRLRGLACEARNDWTQAAVEYRRALEHNAADLESWTRLANADQRAGALEPASRDAKRARTVAGARQALESSLDDYQRASENDANDPEARAAALGRLAAACDALGWTHEASAWESLGSAP